MGFRQRVHSLLLVSVWVVLNLAGVCSAATDVYSIDRDHSFANWAIRHVVSKTSGTFSGVEGRVEIDPQRLELLKTDAVISVFSLNSNHRERDTHLLTAEFLNAHAFKTIEFTSTKVQTTGKNTGVLHGRLTLHGVARDVEFPFEILGFGADPWGGRRVGFQASTRLKRSDFGITYGLDLPGGGPVGDEVEVTLYIEAVKLGQDGKTPDKQ